MRNRTDLQSHEIFHAEAGRHGASNKSLQKREKVVGPRRDHAPARRRDETHDQL